MQTVEERTPVIVARLLEPFGSTCHPLRGAWGADRARAGTGRGWRLGRRHCGRGLSLAPGVTCLDPRATISNACWVAVTHPTGMASGQGEGRFKRSAPLGHSLVLGEDPERPPLLHRFSSPPSPLPEGLRPQRCSLASSAWLPGLATGDALFVIRVRGPLGPMKAAPACLSSTFYKSVCGRQCDRYR